MGILKNLYVYEVGLVLMPFLHLGDHLYLWAAGGADAEGRAGKNHHQRLALVQGLLPYAVQALPLTPMISAMRDVSIYNAQLWDVWPQLAALSGWVILTAIAAVKVFRFS